MAAILGLATALPTDSFTQDDLVKHAISISSRTDREQQVLERLYRRTEIQSRRSVIARLTADQKAMTDFFPAPIDSSDRGPTTAQRMACYDHHAKQLSTASCRQTLIESGVAAKSITHLVTVSCTGFAAPGFDLNLIKELGLPRSVYRTHIGFMGCHGTMNALRVAQGFVAANPEANVLLCATEVCSIHFQYGRDPGDIVANSLFADGAASLIMRRSDGIANYVDSFSYVVSDSEDAMGWRIQDNGFAMSLSAKVPQLIENELETLIGEWLSKHDLSIKQIEGWSIHPGGPRVLDAVERSLQLPADALGDSRAILSEYGNMSSPTVLFIIQRLLAKQKNRFPCVVLAFGPGLTIEAALLRS
ncbi:MAG: type III polyketide synthase [Candidatus Melainabacteria bacterium]|nr:type III polyketide synthase [Candidatus Melainabacteria bacterium]